MIYVLFPLCALATQAGMEFYLSVKCTTAEGVPLSFTPALNSSVDLSK